MRMTVGMAGWLAGWVVAGPAHRLPRAPRELTPRTPLPDGPLPDGPLFSVIVPVRDEQARLPGLLHALRQSQGEGGQWDVIVADDGSTDGSAALAVAAGAKVLSVSPPPGWNGKAWACQCGAEAARGDVLVFLDADTRPAPGFVERLASYASARQAMVSVQPSHRPDRAYEQLSLVCNVVALMAGLGETPTGTRTWWRGPVGFGPAVAVPRQAYLRAGGHGCARADVAEDLALAGWMSRAGLPVVAFADAGEGGITYRMYSEGVADLVEGWSKNLTAGAVKVPALRSALIGLWVTGAVRSSLSAASRPGTYGLYILQMWALMRRAGRFHPAAVLLYPLPVGAFLALFARSALSHLTGRPVLWRGRRVTA